MFLKYQAFTIVWSLLILFLTLAPGEYIPEITLWEILTFDKLAHIGIFTILAFLMIIGFIKQSDYMILRMHPVRASIIIAVSYGLIIEGIQSFIPGREVELNDIIANTLGSLIGSVLFFVIYKL